MRLGQRRLRRVGDDADLREDARAHAQELTARLAASGPRARRQAASEWQAAARVSDFLNLISGLDRQRSLLFFENQVQSGLEERFGVRILCRKFFSTIEPRDLHYIIMYIVESCGIRLTRHCEVAFNAKPKQFHFFPRDIETIGVRIKHQAVVDFTRGQLLTHEAETLMSKGDLVSSNRLLALAVRSFESTVAADSLNLECKVLARDTQLRLAARTARQSGSDSAADAAYMAAISASGRRKYSSRYADQLCREVLMMWRLREQKSRAEAQKIAQLHEAATEGKRRSGDRARRERESRDSLSKFVEPQLFGASGELPLTQFISWLALSTGSRLLFEFINSFRDDKIITQSNVWSPEAFKTMNPSNVSLCSILVAACPTRFGRLADHGGVDQEDERDR